MKYMNINTQYITLSRFTPVGVGLGLIGGGWESSSTTSTSFSINSLVSSGTCISLSLAATNWGVGTPLHQSPAN